MFYKQEDKGNRIDKVYTLLSLGDSVNRYPCIVYSGLVAAIMDEVIGILTSINKELKSIPEGDIVTAYLNIKYRKPVVTPQTVLVSTRFWKVEDRKYFIYRIIKDGFGEILSTAEVL